MTQRTNDDLRQLQALPLDIKISLTKRRINEWINEFGTDGVYVSFSGGKDSTVLLHIVRSMEAEAAARAAKFGFEPSAPIPAVFCNTGLEYPEIQKFAMSHPNVVVLRPEMRFDQVLKKYGYPVASKEVAGYVREAKHSKGEKLRKNRIERLTGTHYRKDGKLSEYNCPKWGILLDAPFETSDKCCAIMKKQPMDRYAKETGRRGIIATMAHESRFRKQSWIRYGCNMFGSKRQLSKPMSFWTEQDVLHYIKEKMQLPLDRAWKDAAEAHGADRKKARKYLRSVQYRKTAICSVYGEIRIKQNPDQDAGQINMIDYLGCYEPQDELETTGCKRTGCIFCMFGVHLEKEPNRYQRLKETHPRQYAFCIGGGEMVDGKLQPNKEGLGLGKALDYIGVKYE